MHVPLTVGDFLRRAALVHGDREAIVDEPGVAGSMGTLTYQDVHDRARGMAAHLEGMGIAPGERVAIVSPNSARFFISFFGVSGFGRVLVPVNYRLNAEEVGYIVGHSGARVLLIDAELEATFKDVEVEHRILLDGIQDDALFSPSGSPSEVDIAEDETATINYTSGTTARPKGVQLTHRNLWLNAVTFGWHVGIGDRDRYLHTLPMFHCNGWGMPYAVTGMAGRHVVQRKIDGEQILERIDREGITLLNGAPAVVTAILDAASTRRAAGTSVPGRGTVRMVVAGAPPPSKVIERIEDELGWEFIQIYGLTETSPLLTINRAPYEWDDLEGPDRASLLSRAGTPAIGVQLQIDDEGEVLARSNVVFEGYWEQAQQSAAALDGGWFHTGDGGHLDGAHLVISDRKKDVIITGGENVSSIEVEDCLFQHPAVAECAVIGVPDEKWGETVKALVVLRPGATVDEAELIAFTRDRLAHFKCPTSIEWRDGLTRTATGKLQKFLLREPYWEARERNVN